MTKKRTIYVKIFSGILFFSLIMAIIIVWIVSNREIRNLETALIKENKLRAEIVSKSIESGYLINQWPFRILRELTQYEDIVCWRIVKPSGEIYLAKNTDIIGKRIKPVQISLKQIIVKDGRCYRTGENIKLIIHPLKIGESVEKPWLFYLGISLKSLGAAQKGVITIALKIFGITFLFIALFSSFLARRFTNPIKKLVKGTQIIGKGNLDYRIILDTDDEFEELSESFNQMTEKLKEQREREKAVSKMKSEFISVAAHQLRTPLSSLKWAFELIQRGSLGKFTKKQQEYLAQCYNVNEGMISLVNSLLNVARIEEGRFLYKYSRVQVADLIENVVENFQEKIRTKKIKFSFEKPRQALPLVRIDSEKIKLVISNLLDNAVRYTPENGKVNISLAKDAKEIIIKIKDNGIGIPESQQKRIFEKFFRTENALKSQTEGNGLGLYIAKNIVEKHKGKIWFESKENKGSVFCFTLPFI